jgi:ribosomal protein L37AE/L43A
VALEAAVDHSKDQVRRAIMQFAARRGCKVTTPWYAECLRIEAESEAAPGLHRGVDDGISGMLQMASTYFLDKPKHRAYVDVELSRKRGQTIAAISFGEHPRSSSLGAMLEAFLMDDAAYETKTPAACPSCTTPVVNLRATYCGRCGHQLTSGATKPPRGQADQAMDGEVDDSEAVAIERREGEEPR